MWEWEEVDERLGRGGMGLGLGCQCGSGNALVSGITDSMGVAEREGIRLTH